MHGQTDARTTTADDQPTRGSDAAVLAVLERTLAYARERSYTGWDYGDGMSSRIRQAIPVDSKWLNIAFQETVKRAPVNVRPFLLVEQHRSYQGSALFGMATQTTARLAGDGSPGVGSPEADTPPPVDYDAEARSIADWLVDNRTRGYSGYCAGYSHPIQHLDGRGDRGEPDIVNTSFGAKALLRAADYDPAYPAVARDAADFVVDDLNYRSVPGGRGAVVDYHTKHPQDYYTVNAGALCARLFVDLYDQFGTPALRERAEALLDHIADLRTDRGGWKYRDPPSASHLSMDTHHNGFIVQCFQRHRAVTGDDRYERTLDGALRFLRTDLFEPDGAPNFDEANPYPRDVNAAAQGILAFTYAGELDLARRILEWVLATLYAGDGRFYYRRERLYTRRVTLMRWCQAWMAFAMSEYLAARHATEST